MACGVSYCGNVPCLNGASVALYLITSLINNAFAVPYAILEEYWYEFYGTIKKTGKLYKHIFIYKTDRGFFIRVGAKGEAEINLSKYMI